MNSMTEYTPKNLSSISKKLKGIYKITCTTNSMFYIGSTCTNFRERWQRHLSDARRKVHKSQIIQRCFDKYGEESFVFSVVEELNNCDIEDILDREQYYIDKLKPNMNTSLKVRGRWISMSEENKVKNRDTLRAAPTRTDNKSGFKGIFTKIRKSKKGKVSVSYTASIGCHGYKFHLGQFQDLNQALKIRKIAEEKFFSTVIDDMAKEDRNKLLSSLEGNKVKLYSYMGIFR